MKSGLPTRANLGIRFPIFHLFLLSQALRFVMLQIALRVIRTARKWWVRSSI